MKIERTWVGGFQNAVWGIRHSYDNHEKSDSQLNNDEAFVLGSADEELIKKLLAYGGSHAKFLRQIFVSADVTAPLTWWKEMDQYKVATTTNSTSTMHSITKYPFSFEQFDTDEMSQDGLDTLRNTINGLNIMRDTYLETKDKSVWMDMISNLPESWLQTRMWSADYATLRNIYATRKNHKLTNWHRFCDWIASLPYADLMLISA